MKDQLTSASSLFTVNNSSRSQSVRLNWGKTMTWQAFFVCGTGHFWCGTGVLSKRVPGAGVISAQIHGTQCYLKSPLSRRNISAVMDIATSPCMVFGIVDACCRSIASEEMLTTQSGLESTRATCRGTWFVQKDAHQRLMGSLVKIGGSLCCFVAEQKQDCVMYICI